MGLILSVVGSMYLGALCVLLAPSGFMQRPLAWLRAISHYRAEITASPNFAYDLCVARLRPDQMEGVDLSAWKIILVGAEPIRAATLDKFIETFTPYGLAASAVNPGFGMAEATLIVSMSPVGAGVDRRMLSRSALQANLIRDAADKDDAQALVGCGYPIPDSRLAIVDPHTLRRLPADTVGELWIEGAHVAGAYWDNPQASDASLHAHIEGEGGTWLRSGDLGFLDAKGQLFITGRIKDLIIIRGTNHYPQDIELTVERAHPALTPERRRGVLGAGRARRGATRRRAGGRAYRAQPHRPGRDRRDHPRGGHRTARGVRAAYRADPAAEPAQDHKRQDPAQPDAQAVAGRQAGLSDGGDGLA